MALNYTTLLLCSAFCLLFQGLELNSHSTSDSTLQLVYVLFRHGNRTPNGPEELYPKDPFLNETYDPFGLGQLTIAGKQREYYIGKYLREKYNKFLGVYFHPKIIESVSTDYNRTKESILLVNAALWPPRYKEIWMNGLSWQPVPYNYLASSEDKYLLGTLCPYYMKLYKEYSKSEKIQAEFNKNQDLFKYISKNTGLNVTNFKDIYQLIFGLKAEDDWGFQLPQWTKSVWPKKLMDLGVKEYFIATGTTNLKRMTSGYFLQRFINDVEMKINGTKKERRIFLNSAHDDNLANLLITLDVFGKPHMPNYGAFIIFEVHYIKKEYGIQIYYQNYVANEPQLLKLPSCETFCEFNKFKSLVEKYLPPNDDFSYQK